MKAFMLASVTEVRPDFGVCQATLLNKRFFTDPKGLQRQCIKPAKVEVDGVRMCLRHAEIAALNYLLEQSKEKGDGQR